MDNIIVKITAQSDMSDATKDFDSLKQKEAEILQGMEALKKKQAEFQGAPKVISLLDAEYKKLEKDLKTNKTSMDSYAASQKKVNDTVISGTAKMPKLQLELRNIKLELVKMQMEGLGPADKAFRDLSIAAGQMRDQIDDVKARVAILSSDTRKLDTVMGVGTGLAGTFGAVTSAAALFGGESEELTKAFLKVQAAQAVLNGVNEVALMLNEESVVMVNLKTWAEESSTLAKIKNYTATKIQAANTALETAANNGSKVAKIGATVTQWALNAAVYAFPAVMIIGALAAIGTGLYLWVKNSKETKAEQDKLNFSIKSTASQIQQIKDNADFDTAIAEASGASAEALFKLRLEAARTANKLAYLNMQQVANNKEATKEQKEESVKQERETYAEIQKIFNEWNVYDIKTKQDANKKKLDDQNSANDKKKQEEEETNKYLLDIDKQLEDSKIAVMKDGIDKQVALIELEYQRKLAAIKENSANEKALRESLEREKQQKIAAITKVEALKGEKLTGDGVLKVFEKSEKNKSEAAKKSGDIIANINKSIGEKTQEEIKNEADRIKQKEDDKVAITQASAQAIGDIGNLLFEGAAEKRQIEMDDLDREYSAKIEAAEGNKALQQRLEDELAAKKLEIRIKQAKADKAQAIFNIGLATAQAVIGMLANPGGVAGIALSVIAGITGAAQIAAALAKPLPKYAKGKKAGGGGHFATVGELGAETMWIPDNAAVIPHNRKLNFDTFQDFGIPAEMDSKWMRGADIDYDKLGASVGKHVKIPTPKPVTVHVDNSGVAVDYSGNKTTFLNKKYQGSWN